jgi:hypothetical protein
MSQSKGKRSKITCDRIRNVEASQRHVEFDRNGTPCGDNASKFMSFISMIARDQVSCTLKEWSDIKECGYYVMRLMHDIITNYNDAEKLSKV